MTPEDLLIAAADDIATHGHNKGTYSPRDTDERTAPACAYGAMSRAATNGRTTNYPLLDEEADTLVDQAAELLARHVRPTAQDLPFNVITRFNDRDETTAEDMILAFKKAAHHDS